MVSVYDSVKEAKAIAWDTCHKIYVLMDDEQVSKMIEYGYEEDMLKASDLTAQEMMNTLEDWYANSCGLRFIEAVRSVKGDPNKGFTRLIEQGEEWRI
jgi:hypothetical protein